MSGNRWGAEEEVSLNPKHHNTEDRDQTRSDSPRSNAENDSAEQQSGLQEKGEHGAVPQTEADFGGVVVLGSIASRGQAPAVVHEGRPLDVNGRDKNQEGLQMQRFLREWDYWNLLRMP